MRYKSENEILKIVESFENGTIARGRLAARRPSARGELLSFKKRFRYGFNKNARRNF